MDNPPLPAHADDIEACRTEAFRLLARGVADRRSAFRVLTLASIGADGAPQARSVVLRGVDVAARCLRLHTDKRSAKWAELAADPRVALHGYDAQAQVQLRLSGTAARHSGDEVAEAAWAASAPMSRRCYSAAPAPGTPIPAPLPAPMDEHAGRPNFAALHVTLHGLDWLWLAAAGHRRARFAWDGAAWQGSWLAP